ncbi:MAG TPA: hypothetical protein VH207_13440 [Chthoniobacterales bacterium]|jgi:hypothetical protein|nr:hypothetical protein [Chthoniobacterales bacterium]
MAVLKKKTRKALRKAVNKAVKKHGPRVARHLVTGVAAGLATYLGAEGDKGAKKLKKAAKSLPGGKQVASAVAATVPLLKDAAETVTDAVTPSKPKKTRSRARGKKKSKSRTRT